MIYLIANIQVKDFERFEIFERLISTYLADVGAMIVTALEIEKNEDGTGEEVHILQFPDLNAFETYKRVTSTDEVRGLGEEAIESLSLKRARARKTYAPEWA